MNRFSGSSIALSLRWIRGLLIVLLLATAALGVGTAYAGTTMTVTITTDVLNGADGKCSLREAVIAANTNSPSGAGAGECPAGKDDSTDTIRLASSAVYTLTLPESSPDGGDLRIYDNDVATAPDIIINVLDNGTATISQNAVLDNRVLYIDHNWGSESAPKVEINGVTITGGDVSTYSDVEGRGGGIYNRGSLILNNSIITGNSAVVGGGIYNLGSVDLNQSTLSSNLAGLGGGIFNDDGSQVTIDSSEISSNTGSFGGGGVFNLYYLKITDSRIVNNTGLEGSAIYTNDGNMDVTGNCIVGNEDTAVYNISAGSEDAIGNWWGASNGPSGAGPGFGDSVSTGISYSGFLTSGILGCGIVPGTSQLVLNTSFDNDTNGDGLPNAWTGTSLAIPPDGRVCNSTNCYMNFVGNGADKKLDQTIAFSGFTGGQFMFSASSRAINVPASGGTYRARVQIYYNDGTDELFYLDFSSGTHTWEDLSVAFTADKAFTGLSVRLRYSKASGEARFDNVTLRYYP
jgi:CSLREA domain-containing protein